MCCMKLHETETCLKHQTQNLELFQTFHETRVNLFTSNSKPETFVNPLYMQLKPHETPHEISIAWASNSEADTTAWPYQYLDTYRYGYGLDTYQEVSVIIGFFYI